MDKVAADIEPEWRKYIDDLNDKQLKDSLDHGMQAVDLPPDVAKQYLAICNQVLWDEMKPQVSPETYNKLRDMLIKK